MRVEPGLFDGAGIPQEGQDSPDVRILFPMLAYEPLECADVDRTAVIEGVDRHQGHVPLPDVRARRLAEARRVAHDVQDVIDDLEGHPEVDPVVPDGLDVLQPRVRQEARDPGSRGHGEGGLPLDDIEVLAPRHPGVVGVALLADLAFGEGGADVRRDLDDVVIEPAADPEGLDEEEVPGHERILEAEFLVGGEAPAAHVPAVIDVVVDQRRGMDQLERRGKVHGLSDLRPAEGAEGEQGDHGSNSLAPGLDHIAGNIVEKGLLGPDALPDPGFDQGQFTSHAKVERTHDPGRPIASYRLALYNYFLSTRPCQERTRPKGENESAIAALRLRRRGRPRRSPQPCPSRARPRSPRPDGWSVRSLRGTCGSCRRGCRSNPPSSRRAS